MKICSKCKIEKNLDCFPCRYKKKGTLRNDCHQCNNERKTKWAKENPEKRKQALHTFYEKNYGKECQYCKSLYKPKGDLRFCSFKCNLLGNISKKRNGCWEWTGSISNSGYGKTCNNARVINAHKASYIMFKGHIPEKLLVLHMCDNKKCINPEHLYLGDHKQNAKDALERGQRLRGKKNELSN